MLARLILALANVSFDAWDSMPPASWASAAPTAWSYDEAYYACMQDGLPMVVLIDQDQATVDRERRIAQECNRRIVVAKSVQTLRPGIYVMSPGTGSMWIIEEHLSSRPIVSPSRPIVSPTTRFLSPRIFSEQCGPGGCFRGPP